MAPRDLIILWY